MGTAHRPNRKTRDARLSRSLPDKIIPAGDDMIVATGVSPWSELPDAKQSPRRGRHCREIAADGVAPCGGSDDNQIAILRPRAHARGYNLSHLAGAWNALALRAFRE